MKRFLFLLAAAGLAASAVAAVTSFTGPRHTASGPAVSAAPKAKPKPVLSDNDLGLSVVTNARNNLSAALANLRAAQDEGLAADELRKRRQAVTRRRNDLRKAYATAVGDFRKASERNDADGSYNLGLCFLNGNGVSVSEEEAFRLFEKSVFDHERNFANDPAAASAGTAGYAAALYQYGTCLREGRGCEADEELGSEKVARAARLGHAPAELALARDLLAAPDPEPASVAEALAFLKSAAGKRLPEAMDAYAKCLADGVGFTPRESNALLREDDATVAAFNERALNERRVEAVRWWYAGASVQQYPPAMVNLARCFLAGAGVDRAGRGGAFDQAAVRWLHRAAMDYGSTDAMRELAECCEKGLGGLDAYGGAEARHFNANWWRTLAAATRGDRLARIWISTNDPGRFDTLFLDNPADEK